MPTPAPRAGLGLLGAGAAGCVACCAAPIAGFLAAGGIATILGAALFGIVGLAAVLAVAGVLWPRRRRRRPPCPPGPGPTTVAAPRQRTPR